MHRRSIYKKKKKKTLSPKNGNPNKVLVNLLGFNGPGVHIFETWDFLKGPVEPQSVSDDLIDNMRK